MEARHEVSLSERERNDEVDRERRKKSETERGNRQYQHLVRCKKEAPAEVNPPGVRD
jgi:hypothetical protein